MIPNALPEFFLPLPVRRSDASRLYAVFLTSIIFFAFMAATAHASPRHRMDANGNAAHVIGHRPAGCPRLYCGCGLAHYLGLHDKRLNLAWNWAKLFPRTAPHPGAAAVRHGHVMLLQNHVEGSRWQVRDYNGGRNLSWMHVRDVRGFVFVDPGARSASLF